MEKSTFKIATVLLIAILTASCLMMVKSAYGLTNPSAPEFTLKLVMNPYDVPSTYSMDPYTGKKVVTDEGYHMENKSIELTIKNQPFTPYKDSNGNYISLMYNIRWKGHYADSWTILAGQFGDSDYIRDYVHASSSEYSVASGGLSWSSNLYDSDFSIFVSSEGGQVDFQVQALIGYSTLVQGPALMLVGPTACFNFTGISSGWSNTQTFTIENSQPTQTSNKPPPTSPPTPTAFFTQNLPAQPVTQTNVLPAFDWKDIAIAVSGVVIAVLVLALVLSRKRSIRATLD